MLGGESDGRKKRGKYMSNNIVKPRHLLMITGNVYENSKGMVGLYIEVSIPNDNKKRKRYNGKLGFIDIHKQNYYEYVEEAIDELAKEMKLKAKELTIKEEEE